MSSLPWSLLLLSLAACGDKEGDDDDDGDADGGALDGGAEDGGAEDGGAEDGGAEDGGAGDGGAGDGGAGDGGAGGGSACPDYMGLGTVGAWREYQTTASYQAEYGISGTYTMEVESISGPVVRARMDSDYRYADGGRALTAATYEYRCDDEGASMTAYRAEGSYDGPSTDYTWSQDTVYSDAYLSLVPDVEEGTTWTDTWASSTTFWTSLSGSSSSTSTGSTSYRAGAESSVTVPAGTFSARRFEATTTTGGSSVVSAWMSERALGQVQSEYYELVDSGG
ncbi:hypothetical protein L6R53_11135 [Myxococcota bacterium]|nr:hypothetical protein [Myxococcota bacterium]